MKTIVLFSCLLFAGCVSVPQRLYVHPQKFSCDLIIPTSWDGCYPVKYFEKKLVIDHVHTDQLGMDYKLVPTDDPKVFVLQIVVPSP